MTWKPKEGGGKIDAEGDNEDTQNKNPKELPQCRLKVKGVDTGKLPQCVESSMDSMSKTSDSKGDNNEVAGNSLSGRPLLINNGSINSSPKAKRRKGKKRREVNNPR